MSDWLLLERGTMELKPFGENSNPWRRSVDPRQLRVGPKELGNELHGLAVRVGLRSIEGATGLELLGTPGYLQDL